MTPGIRPGQYGNTINGHSPKEKDNYKKFVDQINNEVRDTIDKIKRNADKNIDADYADKINEILSGYDLPPELKRP